MKKILIPIGALLVTSLAHAQLSPTENYVYSKKYLSDPTLPNPKASETVQYFDGLGRPKQVVNVKASPLGRDVVTHIEYDGFGRQVKDYLPVPQSQTLNGAIVPTPLANASASYGSEKIYAEKVLENSPLDRVQQQIQLGTDWANKPVKFDYDANITGEVIKYTTTTTWENNATKSTINYGGNYGANQLYKNTVTDEDGNKTIEFKNGQGQVVLVRKIKGTENVDTYYVYNEYNQLAWVIPPLLSKKQTWNLSDQQALAYEYRYDGRGRLVEKKLPGKGWEYMVYDKADRLILTQDANLKAQNKWLITKYDQLGRPAYTGFLTGGERAARQNEIKDLIITESRNTTGFNRSATTIYYTDNAFAGEIPTILSVNYYDTYPNYSFNPTFPTDIFGSTLTDNPTATGKSTKGLPVMSLVKNIEDDSWTKNYSYYDTRGRAVGTYSINHLGGFTETKFEFDFAGMPKQSITRHKRLNTDTERIITETFTYDHQNRLLVHKHKVDNNTEEILAQNKYNELSQLESKKVGGINVATPLQTIDYAYNIRGWMTQINNPANLGTDLFGYKINYNTVQGLEIPNSDFPDLKVKPKYNGNIAEVSWRTLTQENDPLKRYGYSYDVLNRLSAGFYQKEGNESAGEYFEKLDYDLNGNISRLKRSEGALQGTNIAMVVDNLKYDYIGNRLTKVTDEQLNPSGYPLGGNDISYDDNGNMTTHNDKGISSIQYNYLNLPKQITQNSKVTNTTYRADGVKVKKLFGDIETDYLGGFQYKSTFSQESWNGIGTYIPDPNEVPVIKLRIIPTSEGYYDALLGKYIYNFTDHLGNIRLSYSDANKDGVIQPRDYSYLQCGGKKGCTTIWSPGEIVEINNYYPFGMLHNYTATNNNAYQYKYNGKELQETGMYSYGWREYMPDIARWIQTDPLINDHDFTFNPNEIDEDDGEASNISAGIILSNGGGIFNTNNLNPYAYGYNNPIKFDDPDGRCPNCLTAIGGALIGGGLELGGQLLSGKSLNEVDWADVGVETLKGGLIGSGVGAGAALAIETGSVVTKASIDYSAKDGNQNILNGKKSLGKAAADGIMDVAAGQAGKVAAKGLNRAASKALTKATTAETKAATVLARTTNTFNRVTNNGTNIYGSRALVAQKRMGIAQSGVKFARKNTAAAKLVKTAVKNGEVVNKAAQNSISDKIKSFFGIN
ncbi:RHS repeat-associated core domain-containing protein [Chryseobacterium sp. JUb7]|uniref:RHS repeat-associated core domain-containing protein n=1 Tax=Chryseobacterium sp. JUb7 TaxID=2940599 RepID=UPI002166C5BF|nr:RHS repeat-associated core domain-containing protein [Chryseobacterium sp. JUb7]MCS3532914.1 RHS repeat-associated protein [Chryseobacterium sp. JUb7]